MVRVRVGVTVMDSSPAKQPPAPPGARVLLRSLAGPLIIQGPICGLFMVYSRAITGQAFTNLVRFSRQILLVLENVECQQFS